MKVLHTYATGLYVINPVSLFPRHMFTTVKSSVFQCTDQYDYKNFHLISDRAKLHATVVCISRQCVLEYVHIPEVPNTSLMT